METKFSSREGKKSQSAVEAAMIVTSIAHNHAKDAAATVTKAVGSGSMNGEHLRFIAMVGDASYPATAYVSGSQNPNILYQHIHDMSSKRISTLDYFRKAYA